MKAIDIAVLTVVVAPILIWGFDVFMKDMNAMSVDTVGVDLCLLALSAAVTNVAVLPRANSDASAGAWQVVAAVVPLFTYALSLSVIAPADSRRTYSALMMWLRAPNRRVRTSTALGISAVVLEMIILVIRS